MHFFASSVMGYRVATALFFWARSGSLSRGSVAEGEQGGGQGGQEGRGVLRGADS